MAGAMDRRSSKCSAWVTAKGSMTSFSSFWNRSFSFCIRVFQYSFSWPRTGFSLGNARSTAATASQPLSVASLSASIVRDIAKNPAP